MSEEDYTYKASKNRSLSEDDPTRLPTGKRRQFGYDCKKRSREGALYSKVYRWLDSKVGSNWNNVWADICTKLPPKDKAQMFSLMKEHIEYFVYLNCFKKDDGGIYTIYGRVGEYRVDKKDSVWVHRHSFYVFDGILRKTKIEKNKQALLPKVVSFEGNDYYKKDGIWFRVILKRTHELNYNTLYHRSYDSLYKTFFHESNGYKYYGRPIYCHQHFPLKSKELKALKNYLRTNLGYS